MHALDKKMKPLMTPWNPYMVGDDRGYYPWDEKYRKYKLYEFFGFHVGGWNKPYFQ